jgi:hypothetical protein
VGRADGHAPPADIFQPLDLAALPVGDQDVAVSGAKLSQSLLLRGVERDGYEHLDPQGPRSWGQLNQGPDPAT